MGEEGSLPSSQEVRTLNDHTGSQLLPGKPFRFSPSHGDLRRNLGSGRLSETKEISEASAEINVTYVWHNILKTDRLFQRKLKTPSLSLSRSAAVNSWWCNLNWSSARWLMIGICPDPPHFILWCAFPQPTSVFPFSLKLQHENVLN